MTVEFAVSTLPNKPIDEIVKIYTKAEESGFKYGWIPDEAPSYPFRDPYALLGTLGNSTKTLKLGTAINTPYTRHPALLALAIKSFEELFPRRISLGLGAGGVLTLNPLGIKMWDRPITTIREAVYICRQLFNGEEVTFEGKVFKLYKTKLYDKPSQSIPILLAARGPQMLQLAGELADGAICNLPPKTVKWAITQISKGLNKSGRTIKDFKIISGIASSIANDRENARKLVRKGVVETVAYASPLTHELTGIDLDSVQRLKDNIKNGWDAPLDFVTDEMIDLYSFCGTPDDVVDQLSGYAQEGVNTYTAFTRNLQDIQVFREDIIPAFSK